MSFDNPWQWSSTAASNTAITSIDITGATGLVKNGDNALRAIMAGWATVEAKGANVASAGTLALGSQRYYHVTGTTTITDIDFTDAVDGRWAWLIFDGALTLTYNATTLKLPGAANITTVAGDRALFVQDSSDNIICLSYQRAAGTPIAYSEGTFTPGITFGGAAVGMTYSSQVGFYTRIGNVVNCWGTVGLSAKGSSTGTALLTALPFTCSASVQGPGACNINGGSFASLVAGFILAAAAGTTTASFRNGTTTGMASMTEANFTDTSGFQFQLTYMV